MALPKLKAACALVISPSDDRKVLAVSRREDPTRFGLPGGKNDVGETVKQACQRELKEETGLLLNSHATTLLYEGICRHPVTGQRYDTSTFVVRKWSGNVVRGDEGRVEWVTWKTLYAGPFGEYNRAVHAAYKEFLALESDGKKYVFVPGSTSAG